MKPRIMYAVVGKKPGSIHAIFNSKWHAEDWMNNRPGWAIQRVMVERSNDLFITHIHEYNFVRTKTDDKVEGVERIIRTQDDGTKLKGKSNSPLIERIASLLFRFQGNNLNYSNRSEMAKELWRTRARKIFAAIRRYYGSND